MIKRLPAFVVALLVCAACAACSKKDGDQPAAATAVSSAAATASTLTPTPTASGAATVAVPAGSLPPDGKYERVTVDGVTVPMINVMNSGAVVLVDTDGKKPRSWEEQYKRKRELANGQFDVHKTNTNKNDTFEDDTIDKEGLWVIDAKGNITKH